MEEKLGSKYVIGRSLDFAVSFEESGPATPMLFILSPGVDPLKDVEKHGNTRSFYLSGPYQSASECALEFYESAHIVPSPFIPLWRQRFSFSQAALLKSSAAIRAFPYFRFLAQRIITESGMRLSTHLALCLCFYQPSPPNAQQALARLRDYSKGHEYMR